MYSRDFGGIQSEGQLYNYEREYNEARKYEESNDIKEENCEKQLPVANTKKGSGKGLSFLRDLKLDDLLLIGIGLLLLLDSDEENDIFSILIAILLIL